MEDPLLAISRHPENPSARAALTGLTVCFAVFLTIELYRIERPFELRHEDCATAYSGAALNHLRLGPKVMAVFFIVLRCLKSAWLASLGSLVYLLMPLTAYYGRLVNQEPFAAGCMAVSLLLWLNHLEQPSRYRFAASVAAGGIGCLYAWPSFFFMGCMTAEGALRRDWRSLAYALTALVLGILLTGHIAFIAGGTDELVQILRMQMTERWGPPETLSQTLHRLGVETWRNFTLPVIGASALWFLHLVVRWLRGPAPVGAPSWLPRAAALMWIIPDRRIEGKD